MESEVKFYSADEVAQNDGKNGKRTWIVLKNNIYDVTDYLENHPGGGELISEHAGKDATKTFDEVGHSSDAKKELKSLKIGELSLEDRNQSRRKPVVVSEEKVRRSCFSYLTCGICG